MATIETKIGGRKYMLSSEDEEAHLRAVAEMVSKKISSLQKERPNLGLQKISIVAAFDFASLLIKGKKKGMEYRSEVIGKAHQILERVNKELSSLDA